MESSIDQEIIDDIWSTLNDIPTHITLIKPDETKIEYPASSLVYGGDENYGTLNTHAIISTDEGKVRAKKISDSEYKEILPEEEENLIKIITKSQKRKLNYPKWVELSKKNKLPSAQDATIFGSWCYLGAGLLRIKEPTRKRTPIKAKINETPTEHQPTKRVKTLRTQPSNDSASQKTAKVVVVLENVSLSEITRLLS